MRQFLGLLHTRHGLLVLWMCDLPIFPLKCLLLISQTHPILPMNSTTAVVTIRNSQNKRAKSTRRSPGVLYGSLYPLCLLLLPWLTKAEAHTKKVTKKKEISSEDYHAAPFNLSPTHLGRKQNQFLETSKTTQKKPPAKQNSAVFSNFRAHEIVNRAPGGHL